QKVDFTEGKITPKLIKFAIPIMLTGLLQMLYNASDMIVVGNFAPNGSHAMGAVGACSALINMIVGLFIGISVGAGVVVARNVGAKRLDNIKSIIDTSIIFSLICGIIVCVFGVVFAKNLLVLMNTPEEILSEAVPYMQAYFVGVPAGLIYNFLASIVRSTGDSKRPLIFLAVSGLINVLFNMVMVLCFGMGAVGVGIATYVSQYFAMIFIVIYLVKRKDYCNLNLKNVHFSKNVLSSIIIIGLPAGLQSSLFAISNVVIQSSINAYGPEAISGNSAAQSLEAFTYMVMNAFYHGTLTFVGQNMGARKYDRIPKIAISSILSVTVIGLVMGLGIYIFGDFFLSIYEPESAIVREWGLKRLAIVSTMHFMVGVMDIGSGVNRGMGKSLLSMIISLLGSVVLRIVWVYTVCVMFPNNITVLYISYPISWFLTAIVQYICVYVIYKKLKRQKEKDLQEHLV
ncbi:MAG: MATE family efflux transporter, partial [Clostridia bacterium]|nr:MATE family efflux transporter [Clostridia bacterium]